MYWGLWLIILVVNNLFYSRSIHKGLSYPFIIYSYIPFLELGAKGEVSLSGIRRWQS